jgi:hypothetical protein
MRLLVFVLAGLTLAGCGAATTAPGSSGESPTLPQPTVSTETNAPDLRPPPIFLVSAQGKQRAVGGSFCIDYVDSQSGQGQGACGDSAPVHPKAVTAVARGDEVTFVFSEAKVVRPSGCHSDDEQGCIGSVEVTPLGCEDPQLESVPLALGPETRWTVDLEPGAYELHVFGYFESDVGATGDVSGTLGLTVAGPKKWDALGVGAVEPDMEVCPFGE